jgi:hypothetical protein
MNSGQTTRSILGTQARISSSSHTILSWPHHAPHNNGMHWAGLGGGVPLCIGDEQVEAGELREQCEHYYCY